MENHPIPQDITGFQFKLIGKMTVRQFVYLAAGILLAWVFYILPISFVIRLPFIVIFASVGAAFAFVPVDGRPLDTMVINFIKALFAPTEYIYQKQGGDLMRAANPTITHPQQTLPVATQPLQAQQPQQNTTFNMPAPVQTAPAQPIIPAPLPPLNLDADDSMNQPAEKQAEKIVEEEKKTEEQEETIKKELEEAKEAEAQAAPVELPVAHEKTQDLEKMLVEAVRQKEELEKELLALKTQLEAQKQTLTSPAPTVPTDKPPKTPTIKQPSPTANQAPESGIPGLPQEPNLITGVVKDPRGNPLQNILVEVKDAEENPVRAFKTNGLGRFASATSLSNGKYMITFEDSEGKNKFDTVEIEATGAPIPALEVISVDPREELRRELFN